MNRSHLRRLASAAVPLFVGALILTSCSTPATAFHLVGATAASSKAVPGELQLFTGTYTFAADDTSKLSDLHWSITYGDASNPAANPVATLDGVATVTTTFGATAGARRSYQVCLSSIASSLLRTCQVYVVGTDDAMVGNWVGNPYTLAVTESNRTIDARLFIINHLGPELTGPMASPFLHVETDGVNEVWVELVSPNELRISLPSGTSDPNNVTTMTRIP